VYSETVWLCVCQYEFNDADDADILKSKDVERTVGINCRYLGALQTSELSKQDRLFLIEVSCHASPFIFSSFFSLIFMFVPCGSSRLSWLHVTSAFSCTLNTHYLIVSYHCRQVAQSFSTLRINLVHIISYMNYYKVSVPDLGMVELGSFLGPPHPRGGAYFMKM